MEALIMKIAEGVIGLITIAVLVENRIYQSKYRVKQDQNQLIQTLIEQANGKECIISGMKKKNDSLKIQLERLIAENSHLKGRIKTYETIHPHTT